MHIIWIECADHNSKTPSIIIDREIYIWNGDDLNVGNTRVMEIYVLVIGHCLDFKKTNNVHYVGWIR